MSVIDRSPPGDRRSSKTGTGTDLASACGQSRFAASSRLLWLAQHMQRVSCNSGSWEVRRGMHEFQASRAGHRGTSACVAHLQRSEAISILMCLPALLPEWLFSPFFLWDTSVSYLFRETNWFFFGERLPFGKPCTILSHIGVESQLVGRALELIRTGM